MSELVVELHPSADEEVPARLFLRAGDAPIQIAFAEEAGESSSNPLTSPEEAVD
jgi:hypothetical protein